MCGRLRSAGLACIGLVAITATASGQAKRPMTIVDLLAVPSLNDPQLSPDGRQLLYVLTEGADWESNGRSTHIWRVPVGGGAPLQMTTGRGGESEPRWSPDGRWVAFIARRGDSPQIYIMRSDGGEATILIQHASSSPLPITSGGRLSRISWSPDSAYLYFVAYDPKTSAEVLREKAADDVYAFEENYKQRHLWRVSLKDRLEARITGGDYSVIDYQVSRDGRKIAFHRAPTPMNDDVGLGEVWVMDANGREPVRLTNNDWPESSAQLSPDNQQVLFRSMADEQFTPLKTAGYFKGNIFLVPATGGKPRILLPDFPTDIERAAWSGSGQSIFFVANLGVHSELFEVTLADHKVRQLTDGRHDIGWTLALPSNQHVLTVDEPTNAGDVWLLSAAGSGPPTQVTHVFDYLAHDFELPRQEKVQWKGADGVTVEGLLYYPLGYSAGTRYPLVSQNHGNAAFSDKFSFGVWRDYVQVLTAKGYAVLRTNFRGSGGYGVAYQRDRMRHFFNNAHLDILAGVDQVIAMGIADPDRLVVMGWSDGAAQANWLITFTDRFKAASSYAGEVDWISFYGGSDLRHFRPAWFGGSLWQKDAPFLNFWQNSPLSRIANVKTPTLIFIGEDDHRMTAQQPIELYRALKSNGVATRLYIAPREGHLMAEPRHQLFKINVELEWFEKYAMGRAYAWERPPTDSAKVGRSASNQDPPR